ncbi:MAG: hypothetical protein MHM6MM_003194 [Cercozoa sp. M6MM]
MGAASTAIVKELLEFLILVIGPLVAAVSYIVVYLPIIVVGWVKERVRPSKSKVVTRRVAIVGASSGIGRETALHWARHTDVSLVLLARRQEVLEQVAQECREAGANSVAVLPCDASDFYSISGKLLSADDAAAIDTVLVCAAVSEVTVARVVKARDDANFDKHMRMLHLHNRIWRDVTHINVSAATNAALALMPRMRMRRHGVVVFVGSLASLAPLTRFGIYGATKAWMIRFAHALRAHVRHDNVHVCHVLVGPVDTGMQIDRKNLITGTAAPGKVAKHLVDVASHADLAFYAETCTHPWWQFAVSFLNAIPPQCFAWLAKWRLVPADMAEMEDTKTLDTLLLEQGGALAWTSDTPASSVSHESEKLD